MWQKVQIEKDSQKASAGPFERAKLSVQRVREDTQVGGCTARAPANSHAGETVQLCRLRARIRVQVSCQAAHEEVPRRRMLSCFFGK